MRIWWRRTISTAQSLMTLITRARATRAPATPFPVTVRPAREGTHMASPKFSALKSRFAATATPGSGELSLAEKRGASERFGDLATEPDGVEYSYGDADGVTVLFIRPADADQRHVIQYLHGGGYQKCSVESHRKMAGHIAKAAGAVAVSVDYRLTPEHRH